MLEDMAREESKRPTTAKNENYEGIKMKHSVIDHQ